MLFAIILVHFLALSDAHNESFLLKICQKKVSKGNVRRLGNIPKLTYAYQLDSLMIQSLPIRNIQSIKRLCTVRTLKGENLLLCCEVKTTRKYLQRLLHGIFLHF